MSLESGVEDQGQPDKDLPQNDRQWTDITAVAVEKEEQKSDEDLPPP